jgi:UPF0755 protein
VLKRLFWLLILLTLLFATAASYWVMRPLPLSKETIDLSIEPQTSVRGIAKAAVEAGVAVDPQLLFLFFRLSGQSRALRAGSYEINQGNTALDVLRKLSRGEESLRAVNLIDGWTFKQFRNALNKAEGLKHDTQGMSDELLMEKLSMAGTPPEGRFFPDTYTYGKGSSDLRVLQRAANAMTKQLAAAWAQRAPNIQIKSMDEALILASIVEKETGRESDRTTISSVFHNRLSLGMPLQTDPTVIYGMGDAFDGNLRRADLRTDHPWNTYTRKGLPPTPIAMPGKNALLAAVKPAQSQALYFVARGDGTSHFSATLEEHNAAVNRYQRASKSTQAEEAK